MSKTVKSIFFVGGLIAFGLFVGSFGVGRLATYLEKVGWWFIAIISIWGIIYLLNTGAWIMILGDGKEPIRFWRVFQICVSGFALDYVTPFVGLGGEPYRVLALKDKRALHDSLSAVILYSMLHFLSSFLFWIAAVILILFAFPVPAGLKDILGFVLIASALSSRFILSRHAKGIFAPCIRFLRRVPFMGKVSAGLKGKEKILLDIDDKITDFYRNRRRTFYAALSYEFAARFVAPLEYIFILKSVGHGITYPQAVYISAGFSLAANLLFFVPLQLGVREGTFYLILKSLGFASGIGIFVAVVTRIREAFWIIVGLIMVQLGSQPTEPQSMTDLISSHGGEGDSDYEGQVEK